MSNETTDLVDRITSNDKLHRFLLELIAGIVNPSTTLSTIFAAADLGLVELRRCDGRFAAILTDRGDRIARELEADAALDPAVDPVRAFGAFSRSSSGNLVCVCRTDAVSRSAARRAMRNFVNLVGAGDPRGREATIVDELTDDEAAQLAGEPILRSL